MGVRLTDRDKELIKTVDSYGMLSTNQIHKLLFKGIDKRTMLRRLRKLKSKKLIAKRTKTENAEVLWSLENKAAKIVGSDLVIKKINRNVLVHDLLCSDVRMVLESFGVGSNYVSSHYLRHKAGLNKNPYKRFEDVIPDWLFSCELKDGTKKAIALEVELNLKNKTKMEDTLYCYCRKKTVSHLWYLVPSEQMGRKIFKVLKGIDTERPNSWLWVTTIDDFFKSRMEATIQLPHKKMVLNQIIKSAHTDAHTVSILR